MCEIHRDEDENLKELSLGSKESLTLSQMGSGEAFAADDLPLAVATLAGLKDRVTPLEKLLCIKETVDAINNDLIAFRERKSAEDRLRSLNTSQESFITSDELLPLLVFVIVRSNSFHLSATVAYAEYFTFFDVQTTELGFCLTSFKAALSLITESRLLKRYRREKFPDSRFNVKSGRKSLSVRHSSSKQQEEMMKRTISVPGGMTDGYHTAAVPTTAADVLKVDAKFLGFETGEKGEFTLK
jgi:hypothetical protein